MNDSDKDSIKKYNTTSFIEFPPASFYYSQKQISNSPESDCMQTCEKEFYLNEELQTHCTSLRIIGIISKIIGDYRIRAWQTKSSADDDWTFFLETNEISYQQQDINS